jgi:6-phosphogluconolactonase/glucosamine-6-phosphate isomerase/deaminase
MCHITWYISTESTKTNWHAVFNDEIYQPKKSQKSHHRFISNKWWNTYDESSQTLEILL